MVFQPFLTHDLEGRSTCAYVDMFFSADTKNDPLVLKIVVADIHNFAKEFKATTEEELMKSTFAINMLSMDDKHTTAVILDKMKQIQNLSDMFYRHQQMKVMSKQSNLRFIQIYSPLPTKALSTNLY